MNKLFEMIRRCKGKGTIREDLEKEGIREKTEKTVLKKPNKQRCCVHLRKERSDVCDQIFVDISAKLISDRIK
ncbi:unnamed protein product [Rhizophagus irregularis]|nr:unnamed protein product [Rhizophagus irregularis]